ncbi:uncharacterized protein LOC130816175 [Amaranthus tricolor]|uniref:uncharacterized protein LOC130816175 n=1 Tax=Amaranthus tricolor TaxID=29722 RepID=UPI00258D018F|nr:uncharacterized protein LOC130816175 [Amaranthus tricolor]
MACSIGKGFTRLYKNDTISYSFPRKISNSNYSHSSRINVTDKNGFSLKSCADFEDEVLNSSSEDLDYKIRAFRLSQQPFTEAELLLQLQEEKTNGVLDINGGACERGSSTVFSDGNSLPEKIVVAVDVDEVLGNFLSALNRFLADCYSSIHSLSEYHVYEFYKIWKCSRDEADIRVHEFFKTSYFKNGIYPLPGAQKALNKLSRYFSLSRQNVIKDHTIEWLAKHYPGMFEEIHVGNQFALDGTSKPKSEICRSIGAKVLIDDNPRYALECAEVGVRVLLFDYENAYPWCATGSNRHPLVTGKKLNTIRILDVFIVSIA